MKKMTKVDMIKLIQKLEAECFLELQKSKNLFGTDHNITDRERVKWNSIYELMESLGIKTDHELEENKNAVQLVITRCKEKEEVGE
jgi:hypothetical protein